ncbi:MAG: 16S rRNA (cytidine(1402)-2'-O)-methyltransferase [Oscillospiraceae bacterium]|nr:16S rRNA (cytidine(1402)-2'-O)-methyltransferase [Oscillospiraceae bacterium]
MAGQLFVVATPIGNLNDMTPRTRQAFEEADFIRAEDTRVTLKLLNHLGIKKPMVSYYEHNLHQKGEYIIDRIIRGETCAVCSDAGTPCISDPGEVLVKQAHRAGIKVVPIPGPSAVITALSVSGQDTGRFCFEGFLSTVKKQRMSHLARLEKEARTMIFYEAPHKLVNTLKDMSAAFGSDRSMTVARELTKVHEEIWVTTIGEALRRYTENAPKGEFVLIIAGYSQPEEAEEELEDAVDRCLELAESEGVSLSEAAKRTASSSRFSKSEIYRAAQERRSAED